MGYKINYSGLPRQEMYQRALHDARDYLSPVQWDAALKLGVATKLDPKLGCRAKVRRMRFALSFAGIQGPPATAFIKYAWGHMAYEHKGD